MVDFSIHPLWACDPADVETYFKDLGQTDRLALRLCDSDNPNWGTVCLMIKNHGDNIYMVSNGGKPTFVGEFMLNTFTGRAAQIHFSTHPDLHMRLGLPLVRQVVRGIFDWREKGTNDFYLESLFGITPVTNRAACLFVLKVGFKKKFVLPKGIKDRGKYVDAMVSAISRGDL